MSTQLTEYLWEKILNSFLRDYISSVKIIIQRKLSYNFIGNGKAIFTRFLRNRVIFYSYLESFFFYSFKSINFAR